jgi:hypothetical protein
MFFSVFYFVLFNSCVILLLVACDEVILIEIFVDSFQMMCYECGIPENTGHFE